MPLISPVSCVKSQIHSRNNFALLADAEHILHSDVRSAVTVWLMH